MFLQKAVPCRMNSVLQLLFHVTSLNCVQYVVDVISCAHLLCVLIKCTEENAQEKNGPTTNYNPWPGFMFTGKLRPFPVVSSVDFLLRVFTLGDFTFPLKL